MATLRVFCILCLASALWTPAAAAAEPSYVIAVVPRDQAARTYAAWQPLLDRLTTKTGLRFQLQLYSRAREFEADVAAGRPDFIYCNAYQLVAARRAQGYRPLVKADATQFVGLLVVRQDSKAKAPADLDGTAIAFPSPGAFTSSLYLRALLTEREKVRFRAAYVGTQEAVLRNVSGDQTAAGGVASDIFANEPEALRASLRVIYRTPPVPGPVLAVSGRVPEAVAKQVADALPALGREAGGRQLLAAVGLPAATGADYERDYRAIEDLQLDKYLTP